MCQLSSENCVTLTHVDVIKLPLSTNQTLPLLLKALFTLNKVNEFVPMMMMLEQKKSSWFKNKQKN